jgi:hypothetical protein
MIIRVRDVQIAGMAFTSGHNIEHTRREGTACWMQRCNVYNILYE